MNCSSVYASWSQLFVCVCVCVYSDVRWAVQKDHEQANDGQWDGAAAAETFAAGM